MAIAEAKIIAIPDVGLNDPPAADELAVRGRAHAGVASRLVRRRYPMKESPATPKSIIAHVDASGTAVRETFAISMTVPGGFIEFAHGPVGLS